MDFFVRWDEKKWPLADVILYQENQLHYPLDGNLSGG